MIKTKQNRRSKDKQKADYSNENRILGYLKTINNYKLLTAEEECDLAKRIQSGDKLAKDILINSNLKLVVNIAKRYINKSLGLDFMDIVQEGNLGLVTATEKYDPSRGYRFSTYAGGIINYAILAALSNKSRTIRLPLHIVKAGAKYRKAKDGLVIKLNRDPHMEEVAAEMGTTTTRIQVLMDASRDSTISYDKIVLNEDDHDSLITQIKDDTPSVEEQYDAKELPRNITRVLADLSEFEREIIYMRNGYYGEVVSRKSLADKYKLKDTQIKEIEELAYKKIRGSPRAASLIDCLYY